MDRPLRYIYFFGAGQADADDDLKNLVGGKGASLAEMTRAQLNVPPGFTISAACCALFYQGKQTWPVGLEAEVRASLARLEALAGRTLGRGGSPLLVAVRSGAAQSMPGMMDTVLNVGLNPDCVRAMAERTGNARGAWEAYRHFLVMFGHTVAGIPEAVFTQVIDDTLRESDKPDEEDLGAEQMAMLCGRLQETYRNQTGSEMPAEPWELLTAAINVVFRSWNNERALAYRRHHKVDGLLGTAVTVQMMCPSEVSGVMFTANPVNPALEQVLIESSYGLGEAVVLGKVTPDRFVLDKQTLEIIERKISIKEKIVRTLAHDGTGQTGGRDEASLSDGQVADLARLGLRVEDYFHMPCDIEWALSQGQFYLLQARAIKGGKTPSAPAADESGSVDSLPLTAAEQEHVRNDEIAALRARVEPGGTVWSRYNLAEILPEPTPMTWAIVRRFMSGKGGFGQMYRDLGFDPDPAVDEEGIFDLVCGRPYCNLSREPRMQYRTLPFEHPFASLKANPHKALYPQAVLNPARAGWRFWLFLPAVFFKLILSSKRLRRLSRTFAGRFREEIIPAFVREAGKEAAQDITPLDNAALVEHLNYWTERTLFAFARESLKPTALAAVALGNLERALAPRLPTAGATGMQRAEAALRELVMGVHADPETDLPAAIRDLAAGRLDKDAFLKCFGHRGSQEMELSQPRWSEDPAGLDQLTATRPNQKTDAPRSSWAEVWERIAGEAKLIPAHRARLEAELQTLHTYLGLRETAKHYLILGYGLIRRVLVELDQRYRLDGGIFYLLPEELPGLVQKTQPEPALFDLIARRRRRRALALSLPVPQVVFSDDLEAIGREVEIEGVEVLQGVPLSAGIAEGPALVLNHPDGATVPAEGYILVCPSTDPAWVPLFVSARGLVMETGGVLSHGAIVAREFGLPAVAGLPDVHRRLRTGQRLRVDGGTGRVNVLA
jgi:phosphohistidine swiveling domain-containing protein